jgi:hypothetical protein
MMLLGSLATKFLTHVRHFGDHSRNQRRFAPTLPHFTESVPHFSGIRTDGDLGAIGAQLRVTNLLEGSVRIRRAGVPSEQNCPSAGCN